MREVSSSTTLSDTLLSEEDDNTKEGLLTRTLMMFFKNIRNVNIMIPILTESSPISLRILDWFITNYSRDHIKTLVRDPLFKDFNVYSSYKGQLKAFNKKLFDPFCRLHINSKVKKFEFVYDEGGKYVVTTIGQLNFFKWAIENHIIDYVTKHYEEIKADLRKREARKRSSSTSPQNPALVSSPASWHSDDVPETTTTNESSSESNIISKKTPAPCHGVRRAYVIKFD